MNTNEYNECEIEYIKCHVCGSDEFIIEDEDFEMMRLNCEKCGASYQAGKEDDESTSEI